MFKLYLGSIFLVVACVSNNPSKVDIETIRIQTENYKEIKASDLISGIECLYIKTTDPIPFRISSEEIIQYKADDQEFFVFQPGPTSQSMYRINYTGDILKKFSLDSDKLGISEFTSADYDFETKELTVFDRNSTQFLRFDQADSLLFKRKLEHPYYSHADQRGKLVLYKDANLFDESYNIDYYDRRLERVSRQFISPFFAKHSFNYNRLNSKNNELYLTQILNDTIYRYEGEQGFVPIYRVDFGTDWYQAAELAKIIQEKSTPHFMDWMNNTMSIYSMENFQLLQNRVLISFFKAKKHYLAMYNRSNQKTVTVSIKDDLLNGVLGATDMITLAFTQGEHLYLLLDAAYIELAFNKSQIPHSILTIKNADWSKYMNPVLIKLRFNWDKLE
jgi:hypothetical protein